MICFAAMLPFLLNILSGDIIQTGKYRIQGGLSHFEREKIYFKKPKKDEKIKAAEYTIQQYPVLIDHYIRFQEDNERAALSRKFGRRNGCETCITGATTVLGG